MTLICIVIGLSGCIGDEGKFVGTWTDTDDYDLWTFSSGGDLYKTGGWESSWFIQDGVLHIIHHGKYGQYPNNSEYIYKYSFDGNTLVLRGVNNGGVYALVK